MRRRFIALTTAIVLVLTLLPTVVFAVDNNGDGYDDGDVAVINNLIANNNVFLTMNAPDTWETRGVVTWTDGRITKLNLSLTGCTDDIDLSDLTELQVLKTSSCSGITSMTLSGLSKLKDLDCSFNGTAELDLTGLTGLQNHNCSNKKIME